MALKIPSIITKEWVKEHCRCVHKKDNANWLACQESCPVHNTYDVTNPAVRASIIHCTKELGWRLDWYLDEAKEKRV